jgi:hypothetical protein
MVESGGDQLKLISNGRERLGRIWLEFGMRRVGANFQQLANLRFV